jgi:hypothetical protein
LGWFGGGIAVQHRFGPARFPAPKARIIAAMKTFARGGDKRKDWLIGKSVTL